MIPESLDKSTQHEIEKALAFAKKHPRLYALKPAGNAALAIGLGVYSFVHLFMMFSVLMMH
jgi:hypothetical protein